MRAARPPAGPASHGGRGKKPKEEESEEEPAELVPPQDVPGETVTLPERPDVSVGVKHYSIPSAQGKWTIERSEVKFYRSRKVKLDWDSVLGFLREGV